MRKLCFKNLLKNPSLDAGRALPAHWEWVVVSGRPVWAFDCEVKFSGRRSVKILQDVGRTHGQFRQVVRCRGNSRYRLRGRIRLANEGTGEQSGANLCLTGLAAGKEIGLTYHRPFLVGRSDWQLWSAEYVAPAAADSLVVTFDMRNSSGVAWFDDIELAEVPEPLVSCCRPFQPPPRAPEPLRIARSAFVFPGAAAHGLAEQFLAPLLGSDNVRRAASDSRIPRSGRDAIFIDAPSARAPFDAKKIARLAESALVVLTPAAAASVYRELPLRVSTFETTLVEPCARIEVENELTRGFRTGDVVGWSFAGDAGGKWRQVAIRSPMRALQAAGLQTIATAVRGHAGRQGDPVVLWRKTARGGLLVMDLSVFEHSALSGSDPNIPALILSNALGHPQTSFGSYVVPALDYEIFCRDLRRLTGSHPLLRLREEGRSAAGRPIYSVSLGRPAAPTVYVDCGIHPDEWIPCYGVPMYLARLADEYEAGLPWAVELLDSLCVKCVPVLAPDGWPDRNRAPRGVNLNRNFPTYWAECADPEKGSSPLSEPETRVADRILRSGNVIVAVNWHETTANTNWIGYARADGRYRKYAISVPAVFSQFIDGSHFFRQPSTWTQVHDGRNYHFHRTESFPYLRDYSTSPSPFEINYAESLGIDGLIVEQYGNSDFTVTATPQRADMCGFIMEMILGLQIGLVCRNAFPQERHVAVPLAARRGTAAVSVYSRDGHVRHRKTMRLVGPVSKVAADIPAGGCLTVVLDPPPWKMRR